jgi:hypothetical protein
MPLPNPRINSGIFFPPNNKRIMKRITKTSVVPNGPINKNELIIIVLVFGQSYGIRLGN